MNKTVLVHLDSSRGYSRELLKGIYAFNNKISKWSIVYEPTYFLKGNHDKSTINFIKNLMPDACIVEDANLAHELTSLQIPVVQVAASNPISNIPFVKGNYVKEGEMAADYFYHKGFKNLAFLGIKNLLWSEERHNSFSDFSFKNGISICALELNYLDEKIINNQFEILKNWIQNLPKPIGIFCCNDELGQLLINYCNKLGIMVPQEIAVLGIDNDDLICNISYPNLSSIARNSAKIAFEICSVLVQLLDGKKLVTHSIIAEPFKIIERESTNTLADNDNFLIEAIKYIDQNIDSQISVNDVAKNCNLSPKQLNSLFKQKINQSVFKEIQIRKIKRFKNLLETNMPIKEIAFKLGFEDVSHISRWFSKSEGISPNKWRKQYLK